MRNGGHQGEFRGKGFEGGKGKGKTEKGKNFVYIPSKVPGLKSRQYPYDIQFFSMWNPEDSRKEVYEALMMQNPHQLGGQPEAHREVAEASGFIPRKGEKGGKGTGKTAGREWEDSVRDQCGDNPAYRAGGR